MDHILENEGKPVPDPSSVSPATTSAPAAQPMDEDDQDDLEALRSLGVKGAAAAAAAAAVTDVEAKACAIAGHNQTSHDRLTTLINLTEHQMLPMRQSFQKYRFGKLPRREKRS